MARLSRLTLPLFLLFLVIYSWQKYSAAAPQAFSQAYAMNVAILVALTAVLPFILARLAVALSSGPARFLVVTLVPVALCAGGFAIFFFLFIAPNFSQASLMSVLPRSLFPGITISLLLCLTVLGNAQRGGVKPVT